MDRLGLTVTIDLELVEVSPENPIGAPPVLFVHGVRQGAWCWERWQGLLATRGVRSYAVSLRGHGASGGTTRGAFLNAFVDDVVAAAARIPAGNPVLVGHSMGGIVVQRAVHRTAAPGLVLVAPAPAHSGLMTLAFYAKTHPLRLARVIACEPLPVDRKDLVSDEVPVNEAAEIMARLGGESAVAQIEITMPRRTPARANCPVLLLATPEDTVVPPDEAERCAEAQGTRVHWFPGLGHNIMNEPRGDAAAAMVADFVANIPSS
jgi:pimeloyl-ACP methyl ester carboxylesterase